MRQSTTPYVEFWRLPKVIEVTGRSRSDIYRLMAAGKFPKSRPYPDSPNTKFWKSDEVQAWQADILARVDAELMGAIG